jgi:hypothetical protein
VSGVFRLKNDDEPVDGGGEVGTVGLERAKPTGVSAALRRCRGFDGDPAKLSASSVSSLSSASPASAAGPLKAWSSRAGWAVRTVARVVALASAIAAMAWWAAWLVEVTTSYAVSEL